MVCYRNRDDNIIMLWCFFIFSGFWLIFILACSGFHFINNTNSIIMGTIGGTIILISIVSCWFNPIKRFLCIREETSERVNRNIDSNNEPILVVAYLSKDMENIPDSELTKAILINSNV